MTTMRPVRIPTVGLLLLVVMLMAALPGRAFAQGIRSDFNGDRRDDLVVGVPGEKGSSGGVNVLYGSSGGLTTTSNQFFSQAGDVPDSPEANDNCGAAVVAGDFNNDGFADLAFGCPGEDLGGSADMGGVNVLYGSAAGLTVTGSQFFGFNDQAPGDLSFSDKCGTALAAGDFNGDGRDDLAIGCPGREFGVTVEGGGVNDAGRVIVLFGAPSTGLTATGRQSITQATANVADSPEAGDNCGSALAAGLFNDDALADLAIGCSGEDFSGVSDLGGANTLAGSASGLIGIAAAPFWGFADQSAADISNQDRCGSSLAAGDFNGDRRDDLAIGCPGRDVGITVEGGGVLNAGRVTVLNGSATGITATGRLNFNQDSSGILDNAEANDNCGAAVASGDFNDDGFADLIMGCPNEDVSGRNDFGGVNAIYGSAAGLTSTGNQFFAFTDFTSFADRCSTGLAAGDFNGNGVDDLAIGCPGFDLNVVVGEGVFGTFDVGRVIVLYGSAANRLSTTGRQSFTQDTTGVVGDAQEGDAFGFALAGAGGFAAPGLTGSWQDVTQACVGNDRCRLSGTFIVSNPSTQSVPPTVLRIYLSFDATLDETDLLLSEMGVGALKNGDTQPRRLNVLLPDGVDASGQFVIAFADADDIVSETNEGNNVVVFGPVQ